MHDIKQILNRVFEDIQSPKKSLRQELVKKWPQIVGTKLAKQTKPLINDDGKLTVWVDQSTLAFELRQKYQQALLKRAQAVLGEDKVKTIRFYVGQIR